MLVCPVFYACGRSVHCPTVRIGAVHTHEPLEIAVHACGQRVMPFLPLISHMDTMGTCHWTYRCVRTTYGRAYGQCEARAVPLFCPCPHVWTAIAPGPGCTRSLLAPSSAIWTAWGSVPGRTWTCGQTYGPSEFANPYVWTSISEFVDLRVWTHAFARVDEGLLAWISGIRRVNTGVRTYELFTYIIHCVSSAII